MTATGVELKRAEGVLATPPPTLTIAATLAERGSRYGSFADQGRIEQNIKRAMQDSPNWANLPDDSKSALEMIATKVSRVLKGDPEYDDSWRDIAGYATLIVNRIEADGRAQGWADAALQQ